MITSRSISSAVLNWNGREHLPILLPTLWAAHQKAGGMIHVLHNGPVDEDLGWVAKDFPEVRIWMAPRNDFLYSYNWLLEQLNDDIVVLLNNDLRVEEDFLNPLIRHFSNAKVFSVCARSREWDNSADSFGPLRICIHRGWTYVMPDFQNQRCTYTAFSSGGFMAVDRRKFIELGGFDEYFRPAYGEDMDLGFRAWRVGWLNIYEPESVVYHKESASWNSERSDTSKVLSERASFLFHWKHIGKFSLAERLYLLKRSIGDFFRHDTSFVRAYLQAAKRRHEWQGRDCTCLTSEEFKNIAKFWGSAVDDQKPEREPQI